jgi:tetratricopeptide (TPR) repeat protein
MNRTIIYQPLLITFLVLFFAQESRVVTSISPCAPPTELVTNQAITAFKQSATNPGQLIVDLEDQLAKTSLQPAVKVQLLNDLAAIYFWRGQCEINFADIGHALSLINQAIEIQRQLANNQPPVAADTLPISAIYYNRALILETLMPRQIVLETWQEYLQLPLTTDQRFVAQRHIEKNQVPGLDQYWQDKVKNFTPTTINTNLNLAVDLTTQLPYNARLYIFEQLLPTWATAYQQQQYSQAQTILQAANRLAEAIPNSVDGQLVREAVSQTRENTTPELAQGYLALKEGKTLEAQGQFGLAIAQFKTAQSLFSLQVCPAAHAYATMCLALIDPDPVQAMKHIETTIQLSETRNYPYLLGRAWSRYSGIKGQAFEIAEAIDAQTKSIQYLTATASWELLAIGHFVVADVLNQIGEKEDIKQPQLQALQELQKFTRSKYIPRILGGLATHLENLGELRAAAEFHNAAVKLASLKSLETNQPLDPFAPAFTLLRRSQVYYKQDKLHLAQQDIQNAQKVLQSLPDSPVKLFFLNDIRLFQATYLIKSDPQSAIEQLSTLIKNPPDKYYLTKTYRARAAAYRQLGNLAAAVDDLQAAIDQFESQRQTIRPQQRIAFTGEARQAYEEMMELQIEQGHTQEAFQYSEGAKARTLLEYIQSNIPLH